MVGGPAPGRPQPLSGYVTLVGPLRVRVAVGSDGRYDVTVPPGSYQATGRSPRFGSGSYPCRAASVVVVVAGQTTRANVVCQAK